MNDLEKQFQAVRYHTDKGGCGTFGSYGKEPCCGRCIPGSGQGHHYLKFYGMLFEHCRNAGNVVEIGVQDGSSVLMWSDYFQIATITGVDINITAKAKALAMGKNIRLIEGDATDIEMVDKLPKKIDILIDDGSHRLKDQCSALSLLWPLIRPGGWYCIEDIEPRDKDKLYTAMQQHQPEIILTSDTTTRGGLWNSYIFAAQKEL